jgi:hypothetical protein
VFTETFADFDQLYPRVMARLYDTDPDQLACVACGQQWQAISLRSHCGTAPTAYPLRASVSL